MFLENELCDIEVVAVAELLLGSIHRAGGYYLYKAVNFIILAA